jgi:hypothetical protein
MTGGKTDQASNGGKARPYPPSWADCHQLWVTQLPGPSWLYYLGLALRAKIGETTPSEKLVYNGGRGKDGTCLIANQLRPMQTAKAKRQYQSRR